MKHEELKNKIMASVELMYAIQKDMPNILLFAKAPSKMNLHDFNVGLMHDDNDAFITTVLVNLHECLSEFKPEVIVLGSWADVWKIDITDERIKGLSQKEISDRRSEFAKKYTSYQLMMSTETDVTLCLYKIDQENERLAQESLVTESYSKSGGILSNALKQLWDEVRRF